MSVVQIIIKAIKVKLALNRLSRAKENAVRLHLGYPPLVPWYERAYIFVMSGIRQCLMQTFCPCCVYDRNRNLRDEIPRACCARIFHNGTHENTMFKHFIGFFGGVLLGVLLYLMMVFQSGYSSYVAMVIGIVLSPVISLGLAFSMHVRCIILLMAPQMFSSKGRSFLLLYAMILVMTYPVTNFNKNIMIMSNSATCGQEMAYNQTKETLNQIASPLAGVLGSVRAILKALKRFGQLMKEAFTALKTAISEIAGLFKKAFGWLANISKICGAKMNAPYDRCKKIFSDAYIDCKDKLGWFLSWLCEMVTGISYVCNIARIGELFCLIARAVKNLIKNEIYMPIYTAIKDVHTMFYFNVTIDYKYEYNVTQSKSYSQVKDDILKDIKQRLASYTNFISFFKNMMTLSLILVVVKALVYRRKYRTNDRFDNFYLTFKLRDVEERRKERGKEGIFPLKSKESWKYIKTFSVIMSRKEMKKLFKGVFMLMISGFHASFYITCDYGLYWLLDMLSTFFKKNLAAPIPPHLKVHVHGKGAISDMYRALLGSFDPTGEKGGKGFKFTKCIPVPHKPNFAVYEEIGFLFLVCFLMTVFQAYGLRLRHIIAACYYPKREQSRAIWLYNHILKNRGGFLKFARRQMKRKSGTLKEVEKISIRSRLTSQFPLCRKLFKFLGFKRKYCLSCGEEGRPDDFVGFYHCQNDGCNGVYCLDCFTDINNICTVCMNPVDYGDFSDVSEERDSSEDEAEILKRKKEAEKLRKEREEEMLQRRPSQQLRNFNMQLGITQSVIKAQAQNQTAFFGPDGTGAAVYHGYEDEDYWEEPEEDPTWVENADWEPKSNTVKSNENANALVKGSEGKSKGFLSALCPCLQDPAPAAGTAGSEADEEEDYMYQSVNHTDEEYDLSDDLDDDKSETDYVTNEIFEDGEEEFCGDFNYAYIEPDELEIDREIIAETKV